MVRFDKPAPWLGKQLQMANGFRLITCEPANRCRFCGQKEHGPWDCEETSTFSLLAPGTVCTVSTPLGRPKQPAPPAGKGSSPQKKRKTAHDTEKDLTMAVALEEESEPYEEPPGEL